MYKYRPFYDVWADAASCMDGVNKIGYSLLNGNYYDRRKEETHLQDEDLAEKH